MGDEGVSQVIDFDIFEAGFFEVSINTSSNVSDQKRPTGLGNKQVVVVDFWSQGEIILHGGSGGSA